MNKETDINIINKIIRLLRISLLWFVSHIQSLINFSYRYSARVDGYRSDTVCVVFGCADFGCFNQLHLTSVLDTFLYLHEDKHIDKPNS